MIGEIGGPDEAEAAQWCKANMKKPVVGFIAGVTAPPGKRMGHAGALISGGADTADAKLAIMEECGFIVTRNPSELGKLLKAQLKEAVPHQPLASDDAPPSGDDLQKLLLDTHLPNLSLIAATSPHMAIAQPSHARRVQLLRALRALVGALIERVLDPQRGRELVAEPAPGAEVKVNEVAGTVLLTHFSVDETVDERFALLKAHPPKFIVKGGSQFRRVGPMGALAYTARVQAALLAAGAQLFLFGNIADHAVVDDTVEWTKGKGHRGASGFVNAVLRRMIALRGEIIEGPDAAPRAWRDRNDLLPLSDGRAMRLTRPVFSSDRVLRVAGRDVVGTCLGPLDVPDRIGKGLADVLLVDLATAQEWTGRFDRVDRIDLKLALPDDARGADGSGGLAVAAIVAGVWFTQQRSGADAPKVAQAPAASVPAASVCISAPSPWCGSP